MDEPGMLNLGSNPKHWDYLLQGSWHCLLVGNPKYWDYLLEGNPKRLIYLVGGRSQGWALLRTSELPP